MAYWDFWPCQGCGHCDARYSRETSLRASRVEQTRETPNAKFAWCAGFYDGEGSVSYIKVKRPNGYIYHGLHFQIGQSESNHFCCFKDA